MVIIGYIGSGVKGYDVLIASKSGFEIMSMSELKGRVSKLIETSRTKKCEINIYSAENNRVRSVSAKSMFKKDNSFSSNCGTLLAIDSVSDVQNESDSDMYINGESYGRVYSVQGTRHGQSIRIDYIPSFDEVIISSKERNSDLSVLYDPSAKYFVLGRGASECGSWSHYALWWKGRLFGIWKGSINTNVITISPTLEYLKNILSSLFKRLPLISTNCCGRELGLGYLVYPTDYIRKEKPEFKYFYADIPQAIAIAASHSDGFGGYRQFTGAYLGDGYMYLIALGLNSKYKALKVTTKPDLSVSFYGREEDGGFYGERPPEELERIVKRFEEEEVNYDEAMKVENRVYPELSTHKDMRVLLCQVNNGGFVTKSGSLDMKTGNTIVGEFGGNDFYLDFKEMKLLPLKAFKAWLYKVWAYSDRVSSIETRLDYMSGFDKDGVARHSYNSAWSDSLPLTKEDLSRFVPSIKRCVWVDENTFVLRWKNKLRTYKIDYGTMSFSLASVVDDPNSETAKLLDNSN